MLSMFWLGTPRIEREGVPSQFENRKAFALLAYLTVTGERHTRDALTALFWPELDHTRARAALRNLLWLIKKTVGEDWLDIERETIGLHSLGTAWVDVAHFHQQVVSCRTHTHLANEVCPDCLTPLTEAAAVYRGDFLTGFTLADSPAFDEWQLLQTESLRRELLDVLAKLALYHTRRADFEAAQAYTQRWLAIDPLQEVAHRQLMQLYAQTGQRLAALRQYQECVRILAAEVGASPQAETTQLFQSLQVNDASVTAEVTSQLRAVPRYQLPAQPTPFVGREKEVTEIVRLLTGPNCRLLTVVGLGGIGKTRLAIQAAAELRGAFSHSMCFVSLASPSSPDFLIATIADALGFSFHDQRSPRTQLLDYLREKEILLILDNFEQFGATTDLLSEILQSAPRVKLLVTSRERLNLRWEWLLALEGLEFPTENQAGKEPEDYSAVQLFRQTAQRARPDFLLTVGDRLFVIQICQQVAGIPLAIELAAAWVRLFSPPEIAERIKCDSDFLASTLRDIPQRQQSLRVVFEYSWRLLSSQEKELLVRLTVFQKDFCLEAASQVAGATPFVLSRLVDKSLLRCSAPGRYQMLDVIKQYAAEKFQETIQVEATIKTAHSIYYADFLQQREHRLRGPERQAALKEIGEEIANVQAGWIWAIEQGQMRIIAKSLKSLYVFYQAQGWPQTGEEAFRHAAAKLNELEAGTEKNLILGQILARQGAFARRNVFFDRQQPRDKAAGLLQTSLALLQQVGDQQESAFALIQLGIIASETGDLRTAQRLCQEALTICQEMGDSDEMVCSLNLSGIVAYQCGEYIAAQSLWQQSLVLSREIGDYIGIARTLNNLGLIAGYLEEEPTGRKSLYLEMYAVSKESGSREWLAYSSLNLGDCAMWQREYAEAEQYYESGLAIFKEIGDRGGIASSLYGLGELAYHQGEFVVAKQIYQQSLALVKEVGDLWCISTALTHLGEAGNALGEYDESKQCFYEALQIALELQTIPLMPAPLLGAARWLTRAGQSEQALEFITVIQRYSANDWQVKDNVRQLCAELESQLPPAVSAEATERGKGRTLEEAAQMACAFLLEHGKR